MKKEIKKLKSCNQQYYECKNEADNYRYSCYYYNNDICLK